MSVNERDRPETIVKNIASFLAYFLAFFEEIDRREERKNHFLFLAVFSSSRYWDCNVKWILPPRVSKQIHNREKNTVQQIETHGKQNWSHYARLIESDER